MSAFLSRRPNLDPEPWREPGRHGLRSAHKFGNDDVFDPRPEFEPTRDPAPWAGPSDNSATKRYADQGHPGMRREYRPRRDEYDTPVNRVLEFYRGNDDPHYDLAYVLGACERAVDTDDPFIASIAFDLDVEYTEAEIDHARRVLTRLANMTKED